MSTPNRAAGLISGGLDSTVIAAYMREHYDESHFLFGNYGQKTLERERKAFDALCNAFKPVTAEVIDLTWLRRIGSSALFEVETTLSPLNKKREYVPFRNAIVLSATVALAESVEAKAVLIGSTGGDTTCPDNSPSFARAYQSVINEGTMTDKPIELVTPLIDLDKAAVIRLGIELDAPFELSWSCHNNIGNIACGGCTNCISRRQGFDIVGLTDPVPYEETIVT